MIADVGVDDRLEVLVLLLLNQLEDVTLDTQIQGSIGRCDTKHTDTR